VYDRHNDNRFYLDYGRPPNIRPTNATAGEFRVFDTSTFKKIGTIRAKMPFWSAVIANDGKMLCAMAPQKHSILVIDTEKMRQIRVLKIGGMPALARDPHARAGATNTSLQHIGHAQSAGDLAHVRRLAFEVNSNQHRWR